MKRDLREASAVENFYLLGHLLRSGGRVQEQAASAISGEYKRVPAGT
jgi:hypothetical protein